MQIEGTQPKMVVVMASWLVLGTVFVLLQLSPLGEYLKERVDTAAHFWVRDVVWGKTPEQSPKLWTFALDDKTFSHLPAAYPDGQAWGTILRRIGHHKPRVVIIDAVFSKLDDPKGALAGALKELRAQGIKVVLGSFISRNPVMGRPVIPKDHNLFSVEELFDFPKASVAIPNLYDGSGVLVYGPSEEMLASGVRVGHITNTGGSIIPFVKLGNGFVLPEISMHAAEQLTVKDTQVFVGDQPLPINGEGKMLVNFAPNHLYGKRTYSLLPLLQEASVNSPIKRPDKTVMAQGDVVLIIIHMFTGHTDAKWTPVGTMPGGRFLQATINSILTGSFLKEPPAGTFLLMLMILLGAQVGMSSGVLSFWAATATIVTCYGIAVSALFSWGQILLPWLFPLSGFCTGGLLLFSLKTRQQVLRARQLHAALDGAVEPNRIKQLIQVEDHISFDARERVVTILFIDVVGFSRMAENMLPRVAFTELKDLLAEIADVIHRFGGVIDKTLGDGLLCYFGYQFDRDETSPNHAETALRCAIAIQEENLSRNQQAAKTGKNVYPLRIGINTASSFLGDLGSGMRVDFTVVGNGVNFAKRLEGAAEMYAILMGQTTYDFVRSLNLPAPAINKKFIKIKHHNELIEAYEYDVLYNRKKEREEAVEAFRKCANIERVDRRWSVPDPAKITVQTDFGAGHLVNFASKGISLKIPKLLSKGTHLTFTLDSAGGVLKEVLDKQGIQLIQGEVRWSYGDARGHIHGVMFKNLSDEQSMKLIDTLCEFAFAGEGSGPGGKQDGKAS